jgi:hypothetical protein
MTVNKDKVKRVTSFFTKDESGNIIPTKKFTGGSYRATRKVSPTLLRSDSYYRRLLAVLAHSDSPLTPKEITRRYNARYRQSKLATSMRARLGELFVYGLVAHVDVNANGGLWFITPGLDPTNTAQVVSTALAAFEKLRQKP